MQYHHKEQRIYSRARMDLLGSSNRGYRKRFGGFYGIQKKYNKNNKKIMIFLSIILIAFITFFAMWNFINPIFESLCEDKAKSIATIITNEETTKIMNKYQYDSFFKVEKDENNRVRMITANILKINQITSDISINIQKSLEENEQKTIDIPVGSITGIRYLSGIGPRIPLKIACSGNVETELKSEFVAQGVNQTIHRVYLSVKTSVNIITSFNIMEKTIENQVLILENVIVGEIPSTYYNFEGTNSEEDTLRWIE